MSNTNLQASHVVAINALAEFLSHAELDSINHLSEPVDIIVLCGNSILSIADHVFSALSNNPTLAKYLVICGGVGHSTSYLYDSVAASSKYAALSKSIKGLPEARVLKAILDSFYDLTAMTNSGLQVIVEDQSTNCGANAIETRRVLDKHGVMAPKSIFIVQDPTMSLRTLAAFRKVYEDHSPLPDFKTCPTCVPRLAMSHGGDVGYNVPGRHAADLWSIERFLDLIMGEIPRLRDDQDGYGPRGKGFIAHVDIPEDVEEAFEILKGVVMNRR